MNASIRYRVTWLVIFLALTGCLLTVFKASGEIDWPWLVVVAPLVPGIIALAYAAAYVVTSVAIVIVDHLLDRLLDRHNRAGRK